LPTDSVDSLVNRESARNYRHFDFVNGDFADIVKYPALLRIIALQMREPSRDTLSTDGKTDRVRETQQPP